MTTIILVALGIIISTVVAVMLLFYGGDAFSSGTRKAEAARLVSEAAQMEHSVDLFEKQEGYKPGNGVSADAASDLQAKKYLQMIPPGAKTDGQLQSWHISYEDGMIMSSLGAKTDASGKETEGFKVCVEARRQLKFANPENVQTCSKDLPALEPCCIKQ